MTSRTVFIIRRPSHRRIACFKDFLKSTIRGTQRNKLKREAPSCGALSKDSCADNVLAPAYEADIIPNRLKSSSIMPDTSQALSSDTAGASGLSITSAVNMKPSILRPLTHGIINKPVEQLHHLLRAAAF